MYFVTGFTKLPDENDISLGYVRTFGYFEDFDTAEKSLNENWNDMQEGAYPYALIEYIRPGIFSYAAKRDRTCFLWDSEKKGFFRTDPIAEIDRIRNIAIG